jgi:hypothetical protein
LTVDRFCRQSKIGSPLGFGFFKTYFKKEYRMGSLSEKGGHINLNQIEWKSKQLQNSLMVKLKAVPFKVKLFKVAPRMAVLTRKSQIVRRGQLPQRLFKKPTTYAGRSKNIIARPNN